MNPIRFFPILTFSVIALVTAGFVFPGCVHVFVDCVKGNGKVTTELRPVGAFTGVQVKGSTDVVLRQDDRVSVEVEAEENLIPLIRTAVEDGALVIDTRKCIDNTKPVVVHVAAPRLTSILVSGSGNIRSEGHLVAEKIDIGVSGSGDIALSLAGTELVARISGSGGITLKGSGRSLDAEIDGSGDIDASDLPVTRARAHINGSGDCAVNTAERLDAAISGSGDITYRGPVSDVRSTINGSGSVERAR